MDKNKVMDWLNRHWGHPRPCQVCGNESWMLMDNVWELRQFQGGNIVLGSGSILPIVALMCNVCGHLLFFNAIAAQAVDRPSSQEQEEQSDQ